jgi:hypothetical protein
MKAIELNMPDAVHRKLSDLAASEHQPVDAYALNKLEELVRAMERFSELERRAQRGSRKKFDAAMAKVPNVPPMPGDEPPE